MKPVSNRLPVGPGSRGGSWHRPEFRAAYWRDWRAAHLEYRLRERQRMLLNHAMTRLARVVAGGSYERPR